MSGPTKLDSRQSIHRSALSMVGSSANAELDDILNFIDPELAKLFEDRNLLLTDGGQITYTGTTVMFSEALILSVNSQVAGGTPTSISLGSTTRTISLTGRMIYAVINRLAGTAVVTDDSATLPAQTSANQEVVLIAKRVDAGDGTKRLYFRNGTTLNEGQTSRLGAAGSGSGSGSGINYINNPDAEGGTTGWSTYADAAGSSPVDGTAGSPTVVISQTSSSPLRGTNSFLFIKDAANRQGEGTAYDFDIDNADLAKVLNISFDYEIASGTYADGDLTVYIYDITNALVIQPSGYIIEKAATGLPLKQIATFQTAVNSTSYRLIFHVASTSALAYNIKFDNVIVGPQTIQNGTPITDWVQYTPTIVGFGSPTAISFWSRRVGSNLEVQGMFNSGTTTAVTASVTIGFSGGNANVTNASGSALPAGNYSHVGGWTSAGTTDGETAMIALPSENKLYFGHAAFPTTAAGSPMLGNAVVSIGQVVSFSASIPIEGWSSNVQVSSDTDTRVVAAKYETNTTPSLTNGTIIDFEDKIFDTHGAVTTGSPWFFTAPISGIYEISARLASGTVVPLTIGERAFLDIYVNGSRESIVGAEFVEETTTTREMSLGGTTLIQLNAGDELNVRFNSTLTSTFALNGNADHNYVAISRLSGPSLIAATESINARFKRTTSQSIPNSTVTIVDFSTKDYDSHSAVTTGASWIFTAPIPGKYHISAVLESVSGGGWDSGELWAIYAYKNGSIAANLSVFYSTSTHTSNVLASGSTDINLLAGDTLSIVALQNSGAALNTTPDGNNNHVSIHRIGN